jgi:hypothetical protein
MSLDPLSPTEIDALLQPDPRTRCADLLVLRDALSRMAGALEQLADAVGRLNPVVDGADGDAPGGGRAVPPRAD